MLGGRRKTLEVAKYYDTISRGYNELYSEEQVRKYEVGLSLLPPRGKVLDAGCGTGLLMQFVKGYYLGIDISKGMISVAKRGSKGMAADLILGDIELLPLRSNSFETCYSFTVFQNLQHPKEAMECLKRCCASFLVSSLHGKNLERRKCVKAYPDELCVF